MTDAATRQDLERLDAVLTERIRASTAERRADFHQSLGEVRAELHQSLGDVRAELHAGLTDVQRQITRLTLGVVLAVLVSILDSLPLELVLGR